MGEHTESSVLGYLIPLYPPLIARKAVTLQDLKYRPVH